MMIWKTVSLTTVLEHSLLVCRALGFKDFLRNIYCLEDKLLLSSTVSVNPAAVHQSDVYSKQAGGWR